MTTRTSSKETLAKLMATENLLVEHSNVPTAAFDLIKRKLFLPNWKDISDNVYTLLISHEVGHALFTPKDEWEKEILNSEGSQSLKMVVNIVEDVRIEKLIQQKYPGTVRAFKAGYDELEKSNLFGTVGKDINEYGLLDRLNLHFKVGHFGYVNVPFSDKEKPWIQKVGSCKTFSDVVNMAKELIEFVENNPESQGESSSSEDAEQNPSDGDFDSSNTRPKKIGVLTEKSGSSDDNSLSNLEDLDAILDPNGLMKQPSPEKGTVSVETQSHFDQAIRGLVDDSVKKTDYVNLPVTDLSKLIVPYKTVHSQIREYYSRYYPQVFEWAASQVEVFKTSSKNVVNQLANIFEMKKKAKLDVRALTSRTGVLDMNRMHSYRYNDDIFKKVTTIPMGKSHGLVMFIDLSSSMYDNISSTFEQLLNLVLFCRRINIPFEVYGFTDAYSAGDGLLNHPRSFGTMLYDDRFCLRQYFTNRMTGPEFNDSLQNILCMMQYYTRSSYTGIPAQEQLNCTPLNPAIVAAIEVVNQFRSNYGLDIVNTIFLTDGEDTYGIPYLDENGNESDARGSSPYYGRHWDGERSFIRDLKTRRHWEVSNPTKTLLNILREQTGAKVIGFFLAKKRDAQYRIDAMTKDRIKGEELLENFKKHRFAEITGVDGYDAFYIIPNGSGLSVASDEFESEFDDSIDWSDQKQAKKAMKSVQREFANQMSQKVVSRVLLNRFIDHIS